MNVRIQNDRREVTLRGAARALCLFAAMGMGGGTAMAGGPGDAPAPAPVAVAASSAGVAVAPMVGLHSSLKGLNEKERVANAVWAMRAGLNVAALQCQFSPFLATAPNYNAMLRHHSDELAASFKAMTGYFLRTVKGARAGARAFDSYATRTNQSWSTFDAQLNFCNQAALAGRRALEIPKGKFAEFAQAELPKLQESTTGNTTLAVLIQPQLEWPSMPQISDPCANKKRCR